MSLPAHIILEKNRVASAGAWLLLIHLTLVDPADSENTEEFYFVRNNENITFNGQVYTGFPIELDSIEKNSKGELPSVTLKVSNITKALEPYIEDYNGGNGSTVTLNVIHSSHLTEDYSELDIDLTIKACSSDNNWVSFTLGGINPLIKKFPLHRYIAGSCNWKPGSVECGLSISACDRTIEACEANANTRRFGGFPGLKSGGIKIAY